MQNGDGRTGAKQGAIGEPRGDVAIRILADRAKFAEARKRRADKKRLEVLSPEPQGQEVAAPALRGGPWLGRVARWLREWWTHRRPGLGGSRMDRVPTFSDDEWLAMGGWDNSDAPPRPRRRDGLPPFKR